MATTPEALAQWLTQAGIAAERLTVEQHTLLQAAFRFRAQVGTDYYSTRLLSHFLLHCGLGLPVAQIARLLQISRPTASRQQGRSSQEVVQAAHHRMAGRAHGKLLTSVFGLVTGLERLFHLEEMNDSGFALLTGGLHGPTRQVVGAWRRHLPW